MVTRLFPTSFDIHHFTVYHSTNQSRLLLRQFHDISNSLEPNCERIERLTCHKNTVSTSTNRRRSILNFIIGTAVITTIGALLSPLAIAWWQNSTLSNARLPASQMKDLQSQVLAAEKILAAQPDDQVALETVVKAKLQLTDLKGSMSAIERLAAANPQVPEYLLLLGQSQQHFGDRDAAAASYRKVLNDQPQNIRALQGLASLLVDGKKPEAAIGDIQKAINAQVATGTNADMAPLKLLLAQVYVSQQRHADALPIYDELIQANNQDFRPVLARGIVFKQMGNMSEAQSLLSQAAEIAPAQYKDQIQQMAKAAVVPVLSPKLPIVSSSPSPSLLPTPTVSSSIVVPGAIESTMPVLTPSPVTSPAQ
jgi:tetratricopeptide (TPR) repeat protein